jgi:predicted N-formylglutamate amidohydrolase
LRRSSFDSDTTSQQHRGNPQGDAAIVTKSAAPSPFLLLGDHAGRVIPPRLRRLGLREPALSRHIAWDIGVAGLGERLSVALNATFIAQRFSRLVIDCNRDPARADSIPEMSDGTIVPANQALAAAEREARISQIFAPYHARITEELDARAAREQSTIVVALHSFTPTMQGFARPWRFGVLHLGASNYSNAVLARLRTEPGELQVGDNEPYRMDDVDFTVPHHAIARGLDYLELEVRQDLIADAAGQESVADLLARVLPAALEDGMI